MNGIHFTSEVKGKIWEVLCFVWQFQQYTIKKGGTLRTFFQAIGGGGRGGGGEARVHLIFFKSAREILKTI